MFLTYRYRVKDAGASRRRALRAQARAVNFVWNYCCATDREAVKRWRAGRNVKRPTAFDLILLCRGTTKELGIHSDTVDAICKIFTSARKACFPKTPRFRSHKRSLDWIPFSNFRRPAKLKGNAISVLGKRYCLWLSRKIPENGMAKSWDFSTDARGRWYANIVIELPDALPRDGKAVGIDLGLKTLATLSTGEKIKMPAFYRKSEATLSIFKKRRQKARARATHAKVANQRRDYLHRASTRIVRENARIYVGDVSPSKLGKTRMAKSIHDAGWSEFRNMLSYKAIALGGVCEIVSEKWTTQACSECGSIGGPKGIAGLRIRDWVCECGALHDRDVNSAKMILRLGVERYPLAEVIPAH
jgi:putative transposase